jgi:hypothetical protein
MVNESCIRFDGYQWGEKITKSIMMNLGYPCIRKETYVPYLWRDGVGKECVMRLMEVKYLPFTLDNY